jgi:hypothetical protein
MRLASSVSTDPDFVDRQIEDFVDRQIERRCASADHCGASTNEL